MLVKKSTYYCQRDLYHSRTDSPTDPFTILEPQNQGMGEFYVIQKRHSTDFEAPKGLIGSRLIIADEPFLSFRASRSGDRRILCSLGTSCCAFKSSEIVKGLVGYWRIQSYTPNTKAFISLEPQC